MDGSGSAPKKQLDLLLLKAESYSNFILENQKRSVSLLTAAPSLENDQSTAHGHSSGPSRKSKRSSPQKINAGKKYRKTSNVPPAQLSPQGTADGEADSNGIDGFKQPSNLTGKLMPHQLEGLKWLLNLWQNGLNGILADEMGLGKTIQIIALIAHLRMHDTYGPYLIVAPLATLPNWMSEFRKWLPTCDVLLYHGTKEERTQLRRKNMPLASQKTRDFPVIVTSFEMCIRDRSSLERYTWQYMFLDEGHRIKNRKCKLIKELKSIKSTSRLLLTGTPIQNTLEELWSLLNFCSPMIFDDLEVFQSWFDFRNIGKETQVSTIIDTEEQDRVVSKLHEILRPFLLRRLKKDVLPELSAKREIVIYCPLTALQEEYYVHCEAGTLRELLMEMHVEKAKSVSQINKIMNLRKVCNHPLLFGELMERDTGKPMRDRDPSLLISLSGKFKLLDRMLPRLKQDGHKVLLFSQMTKLLDLLEDYLILRGYRFVRLDGATGLEDRQSAIASFNEDHTARNDEQVFVFLLSTRAGGLGINLTAADTVVLFDSDWNPHADSQAQDRCHRFGQTRPVCVYRLLTAHSIEIEVMKQQFSKKKLERLTIQGGDYRTAGRRLGERKALSIDELKALLADDVDLSRMEHGDLNEEPAEGEKNGQKDASSAQGKRRTGGKSKDGAGKGVPSGSNLLCDISEEELQMVMDRDLLFPDDIQSREAASTGKHGDDEKKGEGESDSLVDESDVLVCADDAYLQVSGDASSTSATRLSIPAEGAMYDVIDSSKSSGTFMAVV